MLFLLFNSSIPLYVAITYFLSIIVAITFHEFMHAITADKLGDSTPRSYGRISLNPADHIDPIGFVAMMLLPFGWGKPVPVNTSNFKNRRLGDAITTFMGPFSHVITITIVIIIVKILQNFYTVDMPVSWSVIMDIAGAIISTNLLLMVFNFMPIPPLDGYHVFGIVLPSHIKDSIDNFFARQNFFITLIFIYLVSQLLMPVIMLLFTIGGNIISVFL